MKKSILRFFKFLFPALAFFVMVPLSSCSDNEDVRMPDDILGVWQQDADSFLQFNDDQIARRFHIDYQNGISIGKWNWDDVFYYDPGYNLIIYLSSDHEADVYQVVELTKSRLVFCWVDDIEVQSTSDIGNALGEVIKNAQEGYELNPELYQSFTRVSEDQFLSILDSLDLILDPWQY